MGWVQFPLIIIIVDILVKQYLNNGIQNHKSSTNLTALKNLKTNSVTNFILIK